MTVLEANKRAEELWGRPAFAKRIDHRDRDKRFTVGVFGPLTGDPLPLGIGDSYEAAFEFAERDGWTRERVEEWRLKARIDGTRQIGYDAAKQAFVEECCRRAKQAFVEECCRRAERHDEEFKAQSAKFFDEQPHRPLEGLDVKLHGGDVTYSVRR